MLIRKDAHCVDVAPLILSCVDMSSMLEIKMHRTTMTSNMMPTKMTLVEALEEVALEEEVARNAVKFIAMSVAVTQIRKEYKLADPQVMSSKRWIRRSLNSLHTRKNWRLSLSSVGLLMVSI